MSYAILNVSGNQVARDRSSLICSRSGYTALFYCSQHSRSSTRLCACRCRRLPRHWRPCRTVLVHFAVLARMMTHGRSGCSDTRFGCCGSRIGSACRTRRVRRHARADRRLVAASRGAVLRHRQGCSTREQRGDHRETFEGRHLSSSNTVEAALTLDGQETWLRTYPFRLDRLEHESIARNARGCAGCSAKRARVFLCRAPFFAAFCIGRRETNN